MASAWAYPLDATSARLTAANDGRYYYYYLLSAKHPTLWRGDFRGHCPDH
jgi:hypothetical protein